MYKIKLAPTEAKQVSEYEPIPPFYRGKVFSQLKLTILKDRSL